MNHGVRNRELVNEYKGEKATGPVWIWFEKVETNLNANYVSLQFHGKIHLLFIRYVYEHIDGKLQK